MTDAIVSFAVTKLGDFLIQKFVDRQNLRTKLEWLHREFGYMQSFIQDAEKKRNNDNRVQEWISDITGLAHDTVAILDKINLSGSETRKSGFINSIQTCACICRREAKFYNIGQQIDSLKERLLDISRRRETYGIANLSDATTYGPNTNNRAADNRLLIKRLRRVTSYVDQDRLFVGFQDVTDKLSGQLLKEEPRRSVISIYGMGGLGKTTIARELYNSSNIIEKFPYRAWICVSQEYSTSDLLRSLIKSFRKGCSGDELKTIEEMGEEDLDRHLRGVLKDHKYLAVVDDVWHKEAWESLKRAFPDEKNGSRVIITTRKKDVAERVDDRGFANELRFLTDGESWDLFDKKISDEDGCKDWCSAAMLDLGKEMVKKCGGLPLAIVVLGGLLCHKRGLQKWREVKEHVWRHLKNDSLEISFLLSLSYDDLSRELKQCLLYVGGFPEDSLIAVEMLKWLWMAEGFITSREARMEDAAEQFLNELLNRSMIQVAEKHLDKIVFCRIHDLIRDLAVQKAMEENFFDIYDPRKYSSLPALPQGQRQVVHTQMGKCLSLVRPNLNTHSLVIFNPDRENFELKHFNSICSNFRNLQVLYLEKCSFNLGPSGGALPYDIGNLIHLKFLGIVRTDDCCLPSSLGKLRSLETLFANRTGLTLPHEVSELINLRHLVASFIGSMNIGSLTNLETLALVQYEDWGEVDTTKLVNLRKLMIVQIDGSGNLDSIGKLRSLTTLTLCGYWGVNFPPLDPLTYCQNLEILRLDGGIGNLGQLEKLPRSVVTLSLRDSALRQDPMPVLETFPNLQSLRLFEAYEGDTIACSASGFPELELLCFRDLKNLKNWQLAEQAMPMIKGLGIFSCPLLSIPERFKHISTLTEI